MPIQSVKNQYQGINAHLHSYWQATHKWNRFHSYHIGQLMAMMKAQLLPMGYTAELEESLQIRRVGDRVSYLTRVAPIALEALVEDMEDLEHPYQAIVFYERQDDLRTTEAVGWVELLSPSNKGESRDAYTYLAKRRLLLEKGIVFIEIDYLHETPPTFEKLPDYSQQKTGAHPYRIAVIDPRPEYHQAQVFLHEFDVDNPIPLVEIPLNMGDILPFDFGAAYQKTFEDALYGYDMDYRQLPPHFEDYSPADQLRIATRMLTIRQATQAGHTLDNAPLPLVATPDSLEMALAQLEAF